MSIVQCGGQAVALCGTGGGKLKAFLSKLNNKPIIILSLDNDIPGQKASTSLAEDLYKIGVLCIEYNISEECKDPNELLIKDPARLKQNIEKALRAAENITVKSYSSISAYDLQQARLDEPRWIVKNKLPQGLAIISAPSKTGKS